MYVAPVDSVEAARVVHSWCEDSSINFFWALVGCEIGERIAEHWNWERKRLISWGQYGPGYRTLFSAESFFKTAAVATFIIAIGLEFGAAHFSAIVDRLSDEAIEYGQHQTRAALIVAGAANKDAGKAIGDAAKLSVRASNAERDVETLKSKNLETEKAILPRTLRQREAAQKLERFAGTDAVIQSVSDFEPVRLSTILGGMLELAHWHLLPGTSILGNPGPDLFSPGVWIEAPGPVTAIRSILRTNPDADSADLRVAWERDIAAARALIEVLTENGITAQARPSPASRTPLNAVHIFISLKPMPGQPNEQLAAPPVPPAPKQ